jgi:hypothetical protein
VQQVVSGTEKSQLSPARTSLPKVIPGRGKPSLKEVNNLRASTKGEILSKKSGLHASNLEDSLYVSSGVGMDSS